MCIQALPGAHKSSPPIGVQRVHLRVVLEQATKSLVVTIECHMHEGCPPQLLPDMQRGHTAGIIIHTFEIKSNLILISNPIRAYAYPKCNKPIEKTVKRKPTAPQGRGPGRPGPGPGSQAQTGGAVSCVLLFVQWVSCILGMHMLLLGWK